MPSDPRDAQREPHEVQSDPHVAQPDPHESQSNPHEARADPRDAQHVLPLGDTDETPAKPQEAAAACRSDQVYKLLFAEPEAAKSLIRNLPDGEELADRLDFARMEQRATEGVDPKDLRRSYSDMVLLVPFAGRPKKHLLLLLEFQGKSDPEMLLRFLVYLARALQNIRADARGDGPGIKVAAALPVVVFSGDGGWKAPTDLLEAPPPGGLLAAARPRMPCQVLDVRALARDSEGVREICSWIGQVEVKPSGAVPMRVVHEALEKYPGTEHAGLRQALAALMHEVERTHGVPEEEIAKMATLEDVANNWQPAVDRAIARHRQESEAVGIKKGEAAGIKKGEGRRHQEGRGRRHQEGRGRRNPKGPGSQQTDGSSIRQADVRRGCGCRARGGPGRDHRPGPARGGRGLDLRERQRRRPAGPRAERARLSRTEAF